MCLNPSHPHMLHICGERWQSYCRVVFVRLWDVPKIGLLTKSSVESELLWPLYGKMRRSRTDGVLHFALRPLQVSWDSSEIGTADLPTSVRSVWTVWATPYYEPSVERWDSHIQSTCQFCSRTPTGFTRLLWRPGTSWKNEWKYLWTLIKD